MKVFLVTSFLSICTVNAAFQYLPHHTHQSWTRQPQSAVTSLWNSVDSSNNDGSTSSEFDVSSDETEETILRMNLSYDDGKASSALAAVQKYTRSFPFAAVLPVQPLTYLPGE
mmetsp:Transcript_24565/g.59231  ORF Transcript_24565/g.59231 Transcript_24565/m.59231 type:complete len:113 (+) Transcript_24565:79-417(+)